MHQHQRRNRVQWALRVVAGTPLSPGPYERQLLAQYVRGALSLDTIIALLEEHPASGPGSLPDATGTATAPPADYVL